MNRVEAFLNKTYEHEGWLSTDPKDPGNWYQGTLYGTILGITARDHFGVYQEVLSLYRKGDKKGAITHASKFYKESLYWNPNYDKIDDVSLAYRIFDFGINAGVYTSVIILQKALNKFSEAGLKVDGVFGARTLECTNRSSFPASKYQADCLHETKHWYLRNAGSMLKFKRIPGETAFYSYYVSRLDKYYRGLSGFFRYGTSWMRRLHDVFNGLPDLWKPVKIDLRRKEDPEIFISDKTD
jgi:lysozyme family protein